MPYTSMYMEYMTMYCGFQLKINGMQMHLTKHFQEKKVFERER